MEGRALFFTPAVCRLVRERCVPFARNCLTPSGHAGDAKFWEKVGAQGVSLGNSMFLCSADGKVMDGYHEKFLGIWLASWDKLPASERKPGAVRIEDRGAYEPNPRLAEPPEGGLVARMYVRAFDRDGKGRLFAPEKLSLGISKTVVKAEPNRDYFWLTKDEWQSLVPARPKAGDSFPLPDSIRTRLFRFHMVDGACCLPGFWKPDQIQGGELTLTVEEASSEKVRMRLDGFAKVGPKGQELEFDLGGALHYSPGKKAFTRFDIVALSKGDYHKDTATGRAMPLGIAFELAHGSLGDRRPPFRVWVDGDGLKDYLGTDQ